LTRDPDATAGVYSLTGAWGDPTLATVEKGRVVTEAIVAEIIDYLRREFRV
jgi:creatinine amidohydrolase/Fe(II)-dependent formamide hydrolase-like protein